jgi:hypothetical protein
MFENFQWPEPEEEADEKLIRNVREHGCHVLNVHDHPPFSFSIGLALNCGQAEIVIFGMSPRQATQIINIVRDHAAAGKNYFDGDVSTDILRQWQGGFCRGAPGAFRQISRHGDLVLSEITAAVSLPATGVAGSRGPTSVGNGI